MYELIGVVILVHSSRRLNPTSKGRDLIDICTDSERELTASVLKKKKKKIHALLLFTSGQSRALFLPPASWHQTDKR